MLLNILDNFESYVKDHLSDETRRARKSLIVFSLAAIIIVMTGLVPEKIESMGIVFSKTDQNRMLLLLGLAIIYLSVSFSIYAFADFIILEVAIIKNFKQELKEKYEEAQREFILKGKEIPLMTHLDIGSSSSIIKNRINNLYKNRSGFKLFIRIRIILDFILPLVISIVAILLVFFKQN